VNFAVRARSSLILSCSFYITLLVGMVEGKKRIVDGGMGEMREIDRSSSICYIVYLSNFSTVS